MGHSTGGFAALSAAIQDPEIVRRVVSISGFAQGISMIAIPWHFTNVLGLPAVFATLGLLRDEKGNNVIDAEHGPLGEVLDEGDIAYRASRGNFALVWVQSKGYGLAPYSAWTMRSANAWTGFAEMLEQQTGIDVAFARPGGFNLSLSEREWEARRDEGMTQVDLGRRGSGF